MLHTMKSVSQAVVREIQISEAGKALATSAGLCCFLRHPRFPGHAHMLPRWEAVPALTAP